MKAAIIQKLQELLKSEDLENNRQEIDTLRREYHQLTLTDEEAQKQKFLADGGEEEVFVAEKELQDEEFRYLLENFKQKEKAYEKAQEEAYHHKIETKKSLIAELSHINEEGEMLNTAFNKFNSILERWKAMGEVKGQESRLLQVEFGHQIEKFYNHVNITKVLRDIDFHKNLEIKRALIAESELIMGMENLREKELALRKLQSDWNDTGPVPYEFKDEIIHAFRNNTHKIYESIQSYYDSRREEYRQNLGKKIAICERLAELNARQCKNHIEWKDTHESVLRLQDEWKNIGFSLENETVWQVFRHNCDSFFDAKRDFYKNLDALRNRNASIKADLCEKAESVKDDTNWTQTAKFLRDLQKSWKETGPTYRRNEFILWNRFRAACDHFFENQKSHFAQKDQELTSNLTKKEELIERIAAFSFTGKTDLDMQQLKAFADEWTAIGFVPLNKKDDIYQRYYSVLDAQYDQLKLDRKQRQKMMHQNKIEEMVKSDSTGDLLSKEKRVLRDKLTKVETEIDTYENNLGFFGNKGKSNPLLLEIEKKLNALKREASDMKAQLMMMEQAGKKVHPADNKTANRVNHSTDKEELPKMPETSSEVLQPTEDNLVEPAAVEIEKNDEV